MDRQLEAHSLEYPAQPGKDTANNKGLGVPEFSSRTGKSSVQRTGCPGVQFKGLGVPVSRSSVLHRNLKSIQVVDSPTECITHCCKVQPPLQQPYTLSPTSLHHNTTIPQYHNTNPVGYDGRPRSTQGPTRPSAPVSSCDFGVVLGRKLRLATGVLSPSKLVRQQRQTCRSLHQQKSAESVRAGTEHQTEDHLANN